MANDIELDREAAQAALHPVIETPFGVVFINPGTGPVVGASFVEACKNMDAFLVDLAQKHGPGARFHPDDETKDTEGRFAFRVFWPDGARRRVLMPGSPLDHVRYLGTEGQNIWDFPRLYVDGSSWVWLYAINQAGPFRDLQEARDAR